MRIVTQKQLHGVFMMNAMKNTVVLINDGRDNDAVNLNFSDKCRGRRGSGADINVAPDLCGSHLATSKR